MCLYAEVFISWCGAVFEIVCLVQNPISILFPTFFSKVCDSNPKCQVKLNLIDSIVINKWIPLDIN